MSANNFTDRELFSKTVASIEKQILECDYSPRIPELRVRLLAYQKDEGICCFCDCLTIAKFGLPYNKKRLFTIEHVKPRALGGENVLENYRVSCYACNNERGIQDFETFQAKKKAK